MFNFLLIITKPRVLLNLFNNTIDRCQLFFLFLIDILLSIFFFKLIKKFNMRARVYIQKL